jgi:hypothetical protein
MPQHNNPAQLGKAMGLLFGAASDNDHEVLKEYVLMLEQEGIDARRCYQIVKGSFPQIPSYEELMSDQEYQDPEQRLLGSISRGSQDPNQQIQVDSLEQQGLPQENPEETLPSNQEI